MTEAQIDLEEAIGARVANADAEMIAGYRDGLDPDSPEPSANRSASYRHGFANGRDDRAMNPRSTAQALRKAAAFAIADDVSK